MTEKPFFVEVWNSDEYVGQCKMSDHYSLMGRYSMIPYLEDNGCWDSFTISITNKEFPKSYPWLGCYRILDIHALPAQDAEKFKKTQIVSKERLVKLEADGMSETGISEPEDLKRQLESCRKFMLFLIWMGPPTSSMSKDKYDFMTMINHEAYVKYKEIFGENP